MRICERCAQIIEDGDAVVIHYEKNGFRKAFAFHNRHKDDCLAQEIEELRKRFPKPQ